MPGHPTCTATAAAALGRGINTKSVARASAPGSPQLTTADNGNARMATREVGADTAGWTAVTALTALTALTGTSRVKAAPGLPAIVVEAEPGPPVVGAKGRKLAHRWRSRRPNGALTAGQRQLAPAPIMTKCGSAPR